MSKRVDNRGELGAAKVLVCGRNVVGLLSAVSFLWLNQSGCSDDAKAEHKKTLTIVSVAADVSASEKLLVQACAGLYNRKEGGSVYAEIDESDLIWPDELALKADKKVASAEFVKTCRSDFSTCVRYDYKSQQALLPNILTVASVLDAVPVDEVVSGACNDIVFDAKQEFKEKNTPYLATKYVFEKYGEKTTGLAMLNPGYDDHAKDSANPALLNDMKPSLVDYVFSQKLFVVYLVNGCIDDNPEKELLSTIVNAGNWETPLPVYGYNSSWNVLGGYLYEAQTKCLDSRNMGAIASMTGNMSYFSTASSPITDANIVKQNTLEDISYDPNKTYVAFLVGDGDNISYMMSTRHDWFKQRVDECEKDDDNCPALTWTISPHLIRMAPDVLKWYYDQSHKTGRDYFALPPSGHLYAYPSSLADKEQDSFVEQTQQDAKILGITGTVHWDWLDSWHVAEDTFLPKYASADGAIRGIFPVNVPYMFVMFPWWPADQFYEVLTSKKGGEVVLFRPREWRGIDNDTDPFFYSPEKMADEITGYPKGTVTWVYMTSDGGLTLENSFLAVSKLLPDSVTLVSADTASKLALAAAKE